MNKNEFMEKVTEMVMDDPSMRESLKKLYEELSRGEPATEQKPAVPEDCRSKRSDSFSHRE